ncbi:MAG: hypothetical protein WCY72_12935 [Lysobacteraceae bacterium]
MTFSLAGILAVLSYALPPFLPLILAVLAVLVLVQLLARWRNYRTGSYRCMPAAMMALLAGLATGWWLPALTHSHLAFVTTVIDWVALIAAALGVALVTWLVLHPLSYLVRGPRHG